VSKNLESRLRALEDAAAPKLVYVVNIRPDGTREPLKPGQRYAPYIAELPTVAASAEEWLERVRARGMI